MRFVLPPSVVNRQSISGNPPKNRTFGTTIAGQFDTVAFNPIFKFSSNADGSPAWEISRRNRCCEPPPFSFCLSDMLCLIVQPLEPEAARLPSTVAYANGTSFSFLLNRTTAFFLYGAMRADHDSFAVTIKRSPHNTVIKYLQLTLVRLEGAVILRNGSGYEACMR